MEYKERIKLCRKCLNKKIVWGEGIHCGLTDLKPDFEGTCSYFKPNQDMVLREEANERNFEMAQIGRKKLLRLFLILIGLSAIAAVASFLTFREFNSSNILRLFVQTAFQLALYYMIYIGKRWAKIILIFLLAFNSFISVITIIPVIAEYPPLAIVLIVVALYVYIIYKLLEDDHIKEFFAYQQNNA